MKACPFCGSSRVTIHSTYSECDDCKARGPKSESHLAGRDAWDERATEGQMQDGVA